MKKLESIFGFDVNLDDEGNVVINDMCEYPQLSKNCQTFYNKLELIKIDESKITFPIQLKEWVVTISPTKTASPVVADPEKKSKIISC